MADNKKVIVAIAVDLGQKLLSDITNNKGNNVLFSDSEDEEVLLISCIKEAPPRINFFVERIANNYNSDEFQQNFRMSREAFDNLLGFFNTHLHLVRGGDNLKISSQKQLLAVVWILATPDSYRSIGERFYLAKSTLSKIFFRIVDFLNQVASVFIKFPNRVQKEGIKRYFEAQHRLKGVVGAIDGTYVPCRVPAEQKIAYTNRKLFTAVTLQAVCDHKMRYIDCFVGYPSSVHDSRIFKNSDIYKNVQQNVGDYFEDDEKILGDKAYPIQSWCIPPFIERGNLSDHQKAFNRTHASCR